MSKKVIYSDANGDFVESAGVFEVSEHVNNSAGVADAGKPIVLDAAGQIDNSMLGSIDHGGLTGLGDDDHTQYILVAGTRAFTGDQSHGGFKITSLAQGISGTDAVNVDQLTNAVNGIDWKESARVASTAALTVASAPAAIDGVTLVNGDRVLLKDQALLPENGIYIFNGAGSALTRSLDADEDSEVTAMMTVGVSEGTVNADRVYTVTSNDPLTIGVSDIVFGLLPVNTFVAGNGIDITGTTISAKLLASGGLKFVGDEIAVEPADFAGEGLVDDGADNLAIDWSVTFNDAKAVKAEDINSVANGEGASIVGIEDASLYYTGTDVEAVTNELEAQIGGLTSSTFGFAENNVLADNDSIYPALEKLDLKFGDLGSVANGEGASLIAIEDAAGNFVSTDVEGALSELYTLAETSTGETATVGAGGVTIGDVLYFSAADTVSTMPINVSNRAIGVALETVAAAGQVKYARTDEQLESVIVGATFGTRYYWNGTILTTTIPSGSGQYVYAVGVAKNATDLELNLDFIKKNI